VSLVSDSPRSEFKSVSCNTIIYIEGDTCHAMFSRSFISSGHIYKSGSRSTDMYGSWSIDVVLAEYLDVALAKGSFILINIGSVSSVNFLV
jgi:uncharacterized membrane protein